MFYERYCRLCKDRGKAPSTAAVEMGISKSAVTTWKKLGRTPKIDQLKKVADYFDVSLDYLMDETDDPYDWDADPDARLATVYGPQWDYLMEKHHEDVSAAWEDWVGFQEDLEKDARDTRYEEDEEAENKNAPVVKNHESNNWAKKAGAIPYDPTKVAPLLGTVRAGLPMYAEENIEDYLHPADRRGEILLAHRPGRQHERRRHRRGRPNPRARTARSGERPTGRCAGQRRRGYREVLPPEGDWSF